MKVVLTVYRNIYKMGLQILDMNLIKLDFYLLMPILHDINVTSVNK